MGLAQIPDGALICSLLYLRSMNGRLFLDYVLQIVAGLD